MQKQLATLPGIGSGAVSVSRAYNGPASGFDATRTDTPTETVWMVTFVGNAVSGDLPMLAAVDAFAGTCEAAAAGSNAATGMVQVSQVAAGEAGASPEQIRVSIRSVDGQTHLTGQLALSVDFVGDMTQNLCDLAGAPTSNCAQVQAGSYAVNTTVDLRPWLARGTEIVVAGETHIVSDDPGRAFTCDSVPLKTPHATGTSGEVEPIMVSSTLIGTGVVRTNDSIILPAQDLRPLLSAGSSIRVGADSGSGALGVYKVATVLLETVEVEGFVLEGAEQLPRVAATADGTPVVDAGGSLPFAADEATGAVVQLYRRAQVTVDIQATEEDIETALLSLSGIKSVDVTRYGPDSESGSDWVVTLTSHVGPLSSECNSDPVSAAPCLIVSPTDVNTGAPVADNVANVFVLVNTTVPGTPADFSTDVFGSGADSSNIVTQRVPAFSSNLPVNEVQVVRVRALGSDSAGYGTPAPDVSSANAAGVTASIGFGSDT